MKDISSIGREMGVLHLVVGLSSLLREDIYTLHNDIEGINGGIQDTLFSTLL